MMLDHLGEAAAGAALIAAFEAALAVGLRTRDLGGTAGTEELTRAVLTHCHSADSFTSPGEPHA